MHSLQGLRVVLVAVGSKAGADGVSVENLGVPAAAAGAAAAAAASAVDLAVGVVSRSSSGYML